MKRCAHCKEPSITNLDGDELCQKHANEWCKAEEAAHWDAIQDAQEGLTGGNA